MHSGLDYYYQLDMNSTDDRNMIRLENDIKFIIHGYTDRVQFNETGLISFSTFLFFFFFFLLLILYLSITNLNASLLGWMEPTGFALANATNGIVILLDFKNVSSCSYSRSVEEIVPSIGEYLAQVINELALDTSKIELIGHSLGNYSTIHCFRLSILTYIHLDQVRILLVTLELL